MGSGRRRATKNRPELPGRVSPAVPPRFTPTVVCSRIAVTGAPVQALSFSLASPGRHSIVRSRSGALSRWLQLAVAWDDVLLPFFDICRQVSHHTAKKQLAIKPA